MELRQYIKPILRWWWLILLSTSIASVASFVASNQQPRIYQTSSTLLVGQVIQKSDVTGQDFFITQQLAESYAQIAVRQPVLQGTIDSLGLDMGWQDLKWRIYVAPIPNTQLLVINASDTIPERAKAIANEIANQLILQSPRSPENAAHQERSGFVKNQLDDLEKRIERAQARIKELDVELQTAISARQINDLQSEINNLGSLINNWQANYTELLNFLQGGDSPNYLTIIEPAQVPTVPISPKTGTNVILAASVGLILGVGAAIVLVYIDDTLKAPDELSKALGLATLGSIGRLDGEDYRGRLVTSQSPFSPMAEAYRMMRGNIQFMAVDQPVKSILITSANPGEGKTTTAANLAVTMARADLKTILVDADLRRPALHMLFDVPNLGGLTDLLRLAELDEVDGQFNKTEIENLSIITSGPLPPNPSELLSSQRMAQLLARLTETADVVIFDCAPVLAVSDAAGLSNRVDGVILVTQAGRTRRDAVRRAVERLQQVGANILGGVLNRVSGRSGGYYYPYNYYSRSESRLQRQSRLPRFLRQWQQR